MQSFKSICSSVGSLWAAVLQHISACSTMVLSVLQRSLCSGTWSTSCPPASLTSLSQGCFSHIFTHSSLPCRILPFLKYVFPEVPPWWLRGSAMPCGGAAGAGRAWHGAALADPHRACPAASPASTWARAPKAEVNPRPVLSFYSIV